MGEVKASYTKFMPTSPRRMRFSSRVVNPPASGVPADPRSTRLQVFKRRAHLRGQTLDRARLCPGYRPLQ